MQRRRLDPGNPKACYFIRTFGTLLPNGAHTVAPKSLPTPAVTTIARTPQNVTRSAPRQIDAPPMYAASDPRVANVMTVDTPITMLTNFGIVIVQASVGTRAPTENAAAEANAAWIGLAF